jgi:hypothetical protein
MPLRDRSEVRARDKRRYRTTRVPTMPLERVADPSQGCHRTVFCRGKEKNQPTRQDSPGHKEWNNA